MGRESIFFRKALYEVKTSGQHISSNMFCYFSTWTYDKNKLCKTSDCWSRDMLNFDFLKKGLEQVSLPHSVDDFSRNTFLMLYSFNYQISLSDDSYFLNIWQSLFFIQFVTINFEIHLSFLMKPLSCTIKKSEKHKYLRDEKTF